ERMRRRGLVRAAGFDRRIWREKFGEVIEQILDAEPRTCREEIEVCPRSTVRKVSAGAGTILIPVRVVNRGTHAVTHQGPARHVLRCQVLDTAGQTVAAPATATALPGLLIPQRAVAAALPVPVPPQPGVYEVAFWTERAAPGEEEGSSAVPSPTSARLRL